MFSIRFSLSNTVGYNTTEVKAGQFYMVAVQYADVGSAQEKADFNTFFKTTCAAGAYGDGGDPTYGNAPMIQVLNPDGATYSLYYYISDGDDGTYCYDLTGWCDELGNLVGDDALMALSKGFWFKSATAGTVTCAGQVSAKDNFLRNIPAGQFEIIANPYPTSLNLNTPKTEGITPGAYGDGGDPTYNNAPMIQVLNADGKTYSLYYYLSDGDDGTYRYDLTGWCDELGNLVTGSQVNVGTSFWIKSATAGQFVFSL